MKKDSLYKLLRNKESVGLLCNQSGWSVSEKKYTFQLLAEMGNLRKVFIPEHGLFGELQDQLKLDDTSGYENLAPQAEWISLYNSSDSSLTASTKDLSMLDAIVIDIQDVGSRYYTYTSTIWLLLKKISEESLNISIIVFDKPNPAGRQVEGTRITEEYASFIGISGLPHRHGLTIGELCRYFKNKLKANWELIIYPARKKESFFIAPSPNIPSTTTCVLYSGQCLWEGTNLSEGRGTTLPFETIGAPFLNWLFKEDWKNTHHPVYNKYSYIRPLFFIPVFHKFANEKCQGIQLMLHDKNEYHSLSHSLQLLRYFRERTPEFEWRAGKYEAFNDKNAIELLVGDKLLLEYLDGNAEWKVIKNKMNEEEKSWIKEVSPFLIYQSPLQKLKIK